jgi:hypothetical protein
MEQPVSNAGLLRLSVVAVQLICFILSIGEEVLAGVRSQEQRVHLLALFEEINNHGSFQDVETPS